MSQLTEKTVAEQTQWIGTLGVGDAVTVHWFDITNPGGRIWSGTVVTKAGDNTKCVVAYKLSDGIVSLPYPPADAKIHTMSKVASLTYSAAQTASEGTARTLVFNAWEVTTWGMYLDADGTTTVHQRARNLLELDRQLRSVWNLTGDASRVGCSQEEWRINDLVHVLMSWSKLAQDTGVSWCTNAGILAVGDNVLAAIASYYVQWKKGSGKVLAEQLEREGIRGRLPEIVRTALAKKGEPGK
jgi:hypothetical protein